MPNGSKVIIKLAGNLIESAMVGLRVGCVLINEEVFPLLPALRPSLIVPRHHFK